MASPRNTRRCAVPISISQQLPLETLTPPCAAGPFVRCTGDKGHTLSSCTGQDSTGRVRRTRGQAKQERAQTGTVEAKLLFLLPRGSATATPRQKQAAKPARPTIADPRGKRTHEPGKEKQTVGPPAQIAEFPCRFWGPWRRKSTVPLHDATTQQREMRAGQERKREMEQV